MKKLLLISCLLSGFPALAATDAVPNTAQTGLEVPQIESFVTQHKGKFHGETISYSATVSNMHLYNAKGDVIGDAVTTAYVADTNQNRPVTFVFNGGPGSASIWLHMGLFGPKIVSVPSDAKDAGNAPFQLLDNPLSPLDKTDLVFIDPIGTGFSKLAGKGSAADVWGMAEDAKTVSQIVKTWIAKNNRWNSAKYIAGESYGTTRAAAMQPFLDDSSNPVRMNGLILISQALDYEGSTPAPDNMISFVTYLPTMAATAWYHHKIDQNSIGLEALVADAKAFAVDTYLPALFKGSQLPKAEFNAVADKLAYFTGLPVEMVKRANLRIQGSRHLKFLLADEGLSVGRLDSRYTNDELDDFDVKTRYDAASVAVSSAYNAALNHYFASDLQVKWSRNYVVSSREVSDNWVYDRRIGKEPMYVNSARALSEEMRKNPSMKIMLASGYFDYSTPFFDGEYTFGRYGIDLSRVTRSYYQAGHMMYLHQPDLKQLADDIHQFYSH
ncbi:serine carboxypeptidase [Shewanella avicenniae]|uniref:Serine carboxypeptidase n=1 Tax=Shewanella avicenniae TaxID=2814294 RepID=A0ABX7QLL7_9GAMM|nr:serine carboxypeptidase [Shewanella avicenniae]QSX32274.1 serine carboxypeptidase [Shewanella avicenniae]